MTQKKLTEKHIIAIIVSASLLLLPLTFYLWSVLPQPVLVFSIPIRLAACIIAITAFFYWKDWRTLPLALMFLLMAARQMLTLHVRAGVIDKTPFTTTLSEVPGFVVTLLSLISILYLWNLFSYRERTAQAETKLALSEEKFRTMADFSYDWEEWISPDGTYAYISPSCERITGYSYKDFYADPELLLKIIHPEDRGMMKKHNLRHNNADSKTAELEFRIITKSGQTCWIWHQCRPVFKQDGTWIGRRIANRDITEKHSTEITLQRERDMFLSGPVSTFTWQNDENWTVDQVSKNVFQLLGYSAEEFLDGSFKYAGCVHPDDLDRVMVEVADSAQKNKAFFVHEPYRLITRTGTTVWVLDTTTIIRNEHGDITHYLGYLVDISEQKKQEQTLLEAAKKQEQLKRLESLQTMAAAIAHRFNNAMMAVQGYLELLHLDLADHSENKRLAAAALHAAQGASRVGSMMLCYVGQHSVQRREVSLGDVVRETVTAFKNLSQPSMSIKFIPPTQPLYCSIDRQQVQEVIESILANAVESMDNGSGTVEISFGKKFFKTDSFPIPFQNDKLKDSVYSFCQIKDTGHGIEQEQLPRIFEPFYTTQFVGRGLGLALTVGIMRTHHGAITVESTPKKGTTARMLLPSTLPSQQIKHSSEEARREPGSLSGDILLADDEEIVLDIGKKMLESFGFTVHTARNGQEAVDKIRKQNIDFCAVVLDISMPELDGIQAMDEIRKIAPAVPIVLSSGFSENKFLSKEKLKRTYDAFWEKPFQLSEIENSLKGLL